MRGTMNFFCDIYTRNIYIYIFTKIISTVSKYTIRVAIHYSANIVACINIH